LTILRKYAYTISTVVPFQLEVCDAQQRTPRKWSRRKEGEEHRLIFGAGRTALMVSVAANSSRAVLFEGVGSIPPRRRGRWSYCSNARGLRPRCVVPGRCNVQEGWRDADKRESASPGRIGTIPAQTNSAMHSRTRGAPDPFLIGPDSGRTATWIRTHAPLFTEGIRSPEAHGLRGIRPARVHAASGREARSRATLRGRASNDVPPPDLFFGQIYLNETGSMNRFFC
jgi:hypothetical protein